MTVHGMAEKLGLKIAQMEDDREISAVYCCDLLSVAMAKVPRDAVWVTVIGNKNVVAVASLAEVSCVILAEGFAYDAGTIEAAKGKVSLFLSDQPVYETAVQAGALL